MWNKLIYLIFWSQIIDILSRRKIFHLRIYTVDTPIAFNGPSVFNDVDQSAYGI